MWVALHECCMPPLSVTVTIILVQFCSKYYRWQHNIPFDCMTIGLCSSTCAYLLMSPRVAFSSGQPAQVVKE
jgi:hypothetical protein